MHVLRALLYLRLTTLRNMLLGTLRRLRQPKYLAGALAGAAYFWFFFFRHTHRGGGPNEVFSALLAPGQIELVAALVFTLFLTLIWVTPSDHPGRSLLPLHCDAITRTDASSYTESSSTYASTVKSPVDIPAGDASRSMSSARAFRT